MEQEARKKKKKEKKVVWVNFIHKKKSLEWCRTCSQSGKAKHIFLLLLSIISWAWLALSNTLLPRYSHWKLWHKAGNSILSTNSSSETAPSSISCVFIKNSWYLCCAFIQNSWYLCWQFPALVQQPVQFVKGFIAPNAAVNLVTAQLSLEGHTPLAS